jgi:hypothetical protein
LWSGGRRDADVDKGFQEAIRDGLVLNRQGRVRRIAEVFYKAAAESDTVVSSDDCADRREQPFSLCFPSASGSKKLEIFADAELREGNIGDIGDELSAESSPGIWVCCLCCGEFSREKYVSQRKNRVVGGDLIKSTDCVGVEVEAYMAGCGASVTKVDARWRPHSRIGIRCSFSDEGESSAAPRVNGHAVVAPWCLRPD